MPTPTLQSPNLIWPATLQRPSPPLKLVYLDLNQWIYLAQAATGHRNGPRYRPALEACRTARSNGTALFPLSSTHYEELAKITNPAQRSALASLMEELSGFTALLARPTVMRLELDAALTAKLGPSPHPPVPRDLLGRGFGWALDQPQRLRLHGPQGEVTEQVRQQMGSANFDLLIGTMELITERMMLVGPNDFAAPELQARGWDPLAAKKIADQRADQEQQFQDGVSDEDRRRPDRLRDIILARELLLELSDALKEALATRGCGISDVLGENKITARAMTRSMPSTEVSATLKVEDHRNRDKRWTCNDIFDIDALSLTVPYCDVVVTDSHRRHVLRTAHLDQRMNTVVLAKLTELPAHL